MEWFIFAFLSALAMSGAHILNKKVLFHEHATEFTASRSIFIIIFTLFLIPFVSFNFPYYIYIILFLIAVLVSVGLILLMKSFRHGEVSLVSPLMNISPFFLLIFAFLFLGETLILRQYVGVGLLVFGTYTLQIGVSGHKFFDPLKAFAKSKVVHHLLLAVIIFSITATLDKIIIKDYVDFMSYLFFILIFQSLIFMSIDIYKYGKKEIFKSLKKDYKLLFLDSLAVFLTNLFYYIAVSIPTANISLIIPIRRTSGLFTTIFGGTLFHEKNLLIKVLGSIIMIWGTIFIIL